MMHLITKTMKRATFTTYSNAKQKLLNFPYSRIGFGVLNVQLMDLKQDFLKDRYQDDSLAFSCLKEQNQTHIDKVYAYFSQQDAEEKAKGKEVFENYFSPLLPQVFEGIKSNNLEQAEYNMKIVYYLHQINPSLVKSDKLQKMNILETGTLSQIAYLLGIMIRENDYLDLIEKVNEKLNQCTDDEQKFKFAKIIFTFPEFQEFVPEKIISLCLKAITARLETMNSIQRYTILKYVYILTSEEVIQLTEKLTNLVMAPARYKSDSQEHINVPLIYKLLKIRNRLKLDNQMIESYIEKNPLKFKTVFKKKNLNKSIFLSSLADQSFHRHLPHEIRDQFNAYALQSFQNLLQEQQIDEHQLVSLFKNTLKFYHNLNIGTLHKIKTLLMTQYIPRCEQYDEVVFWSLAFILRSVQNQKEKEFVLPYMNKIRKLYRTTYEQQRSEKDKAILLSRLIQFEYQAYRNKIYERIQPIQFWKCNFKILRSASIVNYLCFLIIKTRFQGIELKEKALFSIMPVIQKSLEKDEIASMKIIYTMMDATNFIEKNSPNNIKFNKFWRRSVSTFKRLIKNDPNRSQFLEKDVKFILHLFKSRKYDFPQLWNFVNKVLKEPDNYNQHRKEFLKGN